MFWKGDHQTKEGDMKNYHLAKEGNAWNLKPEGGSRSVVHAATKIDAIGQTRAYMQHHPGSVKIHKENGQIQEERTYPRTADPKHGKG
jgi:hypothetical protein